MGLILLILLFTVGVKVAVLVPWNVLGGLGITCLGMILLFAILANLTDPKDPRKTRGR